MTADWDGRLAGRARSRRRARLTVTLSVLAGLVLAGAGGWVLLGTSVLGVREVAVAGTSRLDPAEVRKTAAIAPGTPLARLDTGAVAARLADLPAVRAVEVSRQWPRGVRIRVLERQPAAARAVGPDFVLVDRTGVAFGAVPRRPDGLPLVSAPADAGPRVVRVALDVLDALPPAMLAQVREARAVSREHVELRLRKDRRVLWGSSERGPRKAAVLAVLLAKKAAVYDVTAPDAPTTRKR